MGGFALLQLFVLIFPLFSRPQTSTESDGSGGADYEFLPLMLTSVYCAVGLVWAFVRLGVIFLRGA